MNRHSSSAPKATSGVTPSRGGLESRCSSSAIRSSRSASPTPGSYNEKAPGLSRAPGLEREAKLNSGVVEDLLQVRLDVLFAALLGERELFDEQRARGV